MGLEQDDIVVNVQGDQPLLDPRCLEDVTAPLGMGMPDAGCEMTTLAFRIVNEREITDPKDVKVTFDTRGFALYFSRSAIPYARDPGIRFDTYKHLGVYAYTRRFLEIFRNLPRGKLEEIEQLEQLRVLEYGYKIKVVVTAYDSPEVDIPKDIARIEKVILEQALHGGRISAGSSPLQTVAEWR
jgi:3-deoxy-manno-octulosonate cytidylyltransferase (CMP-KDO synthetase)